MENIRRLYDQLLAIQSDTGTSMEKDIGMFIYNWFKDLSYFKVNPSLLSFHQIPKDPFERGLVTALIKGKGSRTVILLHHHDTVDIFEYDTMMDLAFDSDRLKEKLKTLDLNAEIKDDLNDPQWLFARGSADMKASAAIQMKLTQHYADNHLTLKGNILFLSVPDEENMSAGMRYAVEILDQLKNDHSLDYITTINSEPVEKNSKGHLKMYEGSVGKTMPLIYIKGKKSHIGDVYRGFNPTAILSKIQGKVELNPKYSDVYDGEVTPPPTWVYTRDQKKMYDVSIPESAAAYFSILSFHKSPMDILSLLKTDAIDAFYETIDSYNESVKAYNSRSFEKAKPLDLKPLVTTFDELIKEINKKNNSFESQFKDYNNVIAKDILDGNMTHQEATIALIEFTCRYLDHQEPMVILSFCAPIYPYVCNRYSQKDVPEYSKIINSFCKENSLTEYSASNYFLGICDFSYMSYNMAENDLDYFKENMPGWGYIYDVPINTLKTMDIPMLNLGPWGKDLHKITERVHAENAFHVLPRVMKHLIDEII